MEILEGGGSLSLEIWVGGRVLAVWEIQSGGGGGQKCLPSVGGVYFFWNNPIKQNGPKQRETL